MVFMKKIIIALLILIGIIFIGLLGFQALSVCTQLGCINELTIELPEKIPSDNLVVLVDDVITVDKCNNFYYYRNTMQEKTIIITPFSPGKPHEEFNLFKNIDLLQIGYRETCADEITFVYSFQDVSPEYKTSQPNGPYCPSTCYTGKVEFS